MQEFLDYDQLNFAGLAINPHPSAKELLKDPIDYTLLAQNKSAWAIQMLPTELSEQEIRYLSRNPCDDAVDILLSGNVNIDWYSFSANTNPRAVAFMEENLEKVSRVLLNGNSSAGKLLDEKHMDRLICSNESDEAMELLDKNPKYIDLFLLIKNPNPRAFNILQKHGFMCQISSPVSSLVLDSLARNTNPEAIKVLTNNLMNFQWRGIWSNPSQEASELIWACYDNTWKEKYCKFMPIDTLDVIEERMNTAKSLWAMKELCANTNPRILEILKFYTRYINYNVISANPIIFK
jgi:hypothetical protein